MAALGCILPVLAQQALEVKFELRPANARVFIRNAVGEWEYLGTSDSVLAIEASGRSDFRFEAPGWKTHIQSAVRLPELQKGRWPERDTLKLEPESPLTLVKYYWPYEAAALLFAWAFYFFRYRPVQHKRRRDEERLRVLEGLQAEAVRLGDEFVGRNLGDFTITGKIGSGGMATVYRAVPSASLDDKRAVALKVLKKSDDHKEAVGRFRREVQACKDLVHRNIVAVYDWGDQGEILFLAMELVEGKTLLERCDEGLQPAQALDFYKQLLDAVEFAHQKKVYHRDLKPGNVMVTHKGVVKVMDFGLARGHHLNTVTVTGTIMGTPAYMAPEQIQGEKPSAAMDQYALGVVGYQLFTGSVPFIADDPMTVITKHLFEEPRPPRELCPEMPERLEQILLRMMAKEPVDRFDSVAEVRRALSQLEL